MRCASDNRVRILLSTERIGGDAQDDHHPTAVDVSGEVEDVITKGIEDGNTMIMLHGLKRVGVMTDERIGSRIHQPMSLMPLGGCGFKRMFLSPMHTDDDAAAGMSILQPPDACT